MAGEFLFGFQAQLAAGGVNVAAFFAAEGGGDFLLLQRGEKAFLRFVARPLPGQALDPVVRDQIDFRVQPPRQACQGLDLVESVIDPRDQNVFKGNQARALLLIILAGRGQLAKRILAIRWRRAGKWPGGFGVVRRQASEFAGPGHSWRR